MPMINIEDAYILNETGAQVDKVTGLFTKDEYTTSGEKAFAQLNIGASGGGGGGGRNLIDNPFFTINQRGASGAVGVGGYIADRWYVRAGAGVSVTHKANGGITITNTTNFDITYLFPFKNTGELNGKTVTLSSNVNGDIVSATGVIGSTNGYYVSHANNGLDIRCGSYSTIKGGLLFINVSNQTAGAQLNVDLNAVKLETGSVSTLANDAPPDYSEELAKCQRYFQRVVAPSYGNGFGFGRAASATECRVYIPLPVPLRASPSVSITNIGSVSLAGNGNTYACTAMAYSGRSESGVNLSFTASGLTTNQLYLLYRSGSSDVHIDLSADL